MRKSRLLLAVVVAIGVTVCSSSAICADSHAAPWLRMGVGARALAMGGAFTAVADDATAQYWNPAGLTKIENIEATFMYTSNMSVDRQFNYVGYAHWLGVGGLGIGWINAGMFDMPVTIDPDTQRGTDDTAENAIMLSYGMEAGSIMLGGTVKVLHQTVMGADSESGFGLDLGGMFNVSDNVTAGLTIRDVGSHYGDINVPFNWRMGTAIRALDGGLCVAFDVDKVQDADNFQIHLGAEYGMEVHPGYHTFFRTGLNGVEDRAFTAGLGIRVPYLQFDYTYVTEKAEPELGSSHRVSVTARF